MSSFFAGDGDCPPLFQPEPVLEGAADPAADPVVAVGIGIEGDRLERVVREKGCRVMTLGTASYMARPFYEKHGYAKAYVRYYALRCRCGCKNPRRNSSDMPASR